jgi:hypothetical protein
LGNENACTLFLTKMRALEWPYSSFTLVLFQWLYPTCLPMYSVSQIGDYCLKPRWMLDYEDLLMVSYCTMHLLALMVCLWRQPEIHIMTVSWYYSSLFMFCLDVGYSLHMMTLILWSIWRSPFLSKGIEVGYSILGYWHLSLYILSTLFFIGIHWCYIMLSSRTWLLQSNVGLRGST